MNPSVAWIIVAIGVITAVSIAIRLIFLRRSGRSPKNPAVWIGAIVVCTVVFTIAGWYTIPSG